MFTASMTLSSGSLSPGHAEARRIAGIPGDLPPRILLISRPFYPCCSSPRFYPREYDTYLSSLSFLCFKVLWFIFLSPFYETRFVVAAGRSHKFSQTIISINAAPKLHYSSIRPVQLNFLVFTPQRPR